MRVSTKQAVGSNLAEDQDNDGNHDISRDLYYGTSAQTTHEQRRGKDRYENIGKVVTSQSGSQKPIGLAHKSFEND